MRRTAVRVIAIVTVPMLAVLLVHAPPVRRAVLRYAIAELEQRFHIRLTATGIDYNLAALRVSLAGVRVAAARTPDTPFFVADVVRAELARSAVFGTLAFDDVTVQGGRVAIVRTASGSNLPEGQGDGGEPPALHIAHIAAPRLRIDVRDQPDRLVVTLPALSVELTSTTGRIALDAPGTIVRADHTTQLAQFTGDATFDGRAIRLRRATAQMTEGRATLQGVLSLLVAEPGMDLQVSGVADVARLASWGMPVTDAPRGEVTFNGRVTGPFATPVADLDLAVASLSIDALTVRALRARAHATIQAIDVTRGGLMLGGGPVAFDARLALDAAARSQINATWSGIDVAGFIQPFAPRDALLPAGIGSGELTGTGKLTGPETWTVDAALRIAGTSNALHRLTLPGASHIHFADGEWSLAGEHAIGGVAPAMLTLRARPAAAGMARAPLAGTVTVADADVPRLLQVLREAGLVDADTSPVEAGRLMAALDVTGVLEAPRLSGHATIVNGRVAGQTLAPIAADVTYDAATAAYRLDATGRLDNASWNEIPLGDIEAALAVSDGQGHLTVTAPRFAARAVATTRLEAPFATVVDVTADSLNLATLAVPLRSPTLITGTGALTGHAEGPLANWRQGRASIDVTHLDAAAGMLPIAIEGPIRLTIANERLRIDQAVITAGAARVSASGELGLASPGAAGITVAATGDLGDLVAAARAAGLADPPVIGAAGPVSVIARINGSLQAPELSADAELGPAAVAVPGSPLVTDVRASAHLANDTVELRSGSASYQGAQMTVTGLAPLAWLTAAAAMPATATPARLSARFLNISPSVLEPFVDPAALAELSGSLDASIDVQSASATLAALTGEARIDRLDVRIADLPVTQRVPTRVVAQDGFARIAAWDWTGQGANLTLAGQVRLANLQAGILANGDLDLRLLNPFIQQSGLTATGRVQPRLSIAGSLTAPRVDGDLTLTDSELRLAEPRVVITSLNGRAVLSRSTAQLTTLTGSINGGDLTGGGTVALVGTDQVTAALTASIRGMAMELPRGLRSELNADLTLDTARTFADPPVMSGQLAGTVTVVRGSYREPLAVVGGVLAAASARAAIGNAEPSPFLDALTLDVRIVTDEDISVNNNTARLDLGGDLRLIGTGSMPGLSGRAEIREGGRVFLGRNVYEVTSGRIDFTNPSTIEPELSIELTTRAGGEDIDVTLSGTATNPSVLLSSSNPDLSQADLTALLVTGRHFDQLASADAALIGNTVLGNLSGDVLGFAGRAVGLDTLRLGGVDDVMRRDPTAIATETDPTSRLTFGKSFGAKVDVTLSQSLRASDAQTWIVDYVPSRRINLRLVSDDEDLRSYEFRHNLEFGVPPRVQSANVSRSVAPRVAAVRVTGELGVPEAEVRDLLQLEAGDRFAFAGWQDDRERLERFYRDHDRLTARIGSTRQTDSNSVTLTYDIHAGPVTRIAVSGATLPDRTLSLLRDAWAGAIADDLVRGEAAAIVTAALADEGYLRPAVMTQLASEGDSRVLSITIAPGSRTTDFRVSVSGATDDITSELEAWTKTGDRARQAARDAASFQAAVASHLQERGFAASRVRLAAPTFDGDTAVVPVVVDAGLALTIAATRFEGVSLLVTDLADITDLTAGDALAFGAVDAARDRLITYYRREGFPSVGVTVRQEASATATARDVVFVVSEGPRQRIDDVAITGNRRVDADVITRALRLERQQPLRADDLLQARRRLFDTGLFRRVDLTTGPAEAPPGASPDATAIPMVVGVVVEEWPLLRLRYGFEVAEQHPDDDPAGKNLVPGLSADVTRRTMFGRPIATGAAARYQPRERNARIFVNAPTMVSLPIESSFTVERSRQEFADATLISDVTGFSWEQRSRVATHLQLSYAYRFERNHTFDTKPNVGSELQFDITVNIARFTGNAAWDSRNDPGDPARGTLISSSLEWGPEKAGSDIRFIRYVEQAYRYTPWRRLVFASAARVGLVTPLGGQDLIPSVRFFGGGSRSVRGVNEDGLGPRDFFGPSGGQAQVILNQEARFPIYRWVRGVGFVDAGNVFTRPRDVSLGDLTASVGVGLRLATPFALLRVDYGRVVSGDTQTGRWTFGIGHAF